MRPAGIAATGACGYRAKGGNSVVEVKHGLACSLLGLLKKKVRSEVAAALNSPFNQKGSWGIKLRPFETPAPKRQV